MEADRKMNLVAAIVGVLVIGGIATGVGTYAVTANQPAAPTPTPTATVEVDPASFPVPTTPDRVVDQAASDALEAQRAAEAEAARIAAEQAAAAQAEADRLAAEKAAAEQSRQSTNTNSGGSNSGGSNSGGSGGTSQPAPIRCPAGSQALSGDGGNDTSCLPEICFRITLPDAAHPECENPFRP
jgi:hypothetical protein